MKQHLSSQCRRLEYTEILIESYLKLLRGGGIMTEAYQKSVFRSCKRRSELLENDTCIQNGFGEWIWSNHASHVISPPKD